MNSAVLGLIALAICLLAYIGLRRHSGKPKASLGIDSLDPRTILFSLATISDPLPPLDGVAPESGEALRLHEDDWRQIEFVAHRDIDGVNQELAELAAFKLTNRVGQGWKEMYVRQSRARALLPLRIPMAGLLSVLPSEAAMLPLVIEAARAPAAVKGGFSQELSPGIMLYGHVVEGMLASLSLRLAQDVAEEPALSPLVQTICERFGLKVVNWYRGSWA